MEQPDELEREYESLMEQMFLLKTHCNMSFMEMDSLTAEDRAWWMRRFKRHQEEQDKSQNSSMPSMPSRPSMPSMPSIPRR